MKKSKLLTLPLLLLLNGCNEEPKRYEYPLHELDITFDYDNEVYDVIIEGEHHYVDLEHTKIIVSYDNEIVFLDYPNSPDELIFYTTLNY